MLPSYLDEHAPPRHEIGHARPSDLSSTRQRPLKLKSASTSLSPTDRGDVSSNTLTINVDCAASFITTSLAYPGPTPSFRGQRRPVPPGVDRYFLAHGKIRFRNAPDRRFREPIRYKSISYDLLRLTAFFSIYIQMHYTQ